MSWQPSVGEVAFAVASLLLALQGSVAATLGGGGLTTPESTNGSSSSSSSSGISPNVTRRQLPTLPPPRPSPPPIPQCYPGVNQVSCFIDPCISLVSSFPCLNVKATCRPGYCGSCYADYYIGDTRLRSCSCCRKKPLVGGNPCASTACLLFPEAKCEVNFCVEGDPTARFYVNGTIDVTPLCG